ncbi:hypothetical protein H2199_003158 [Coniosporium tulheliwenetii]|uniref:Uncharacterized protein n=1 Tax=Coniosporium tulheliwenetii TaxID=3383036 RepID=A0ACC2ZCG1_9PEZI|nr:hypothetical protein H2199_003158 [Cladosporium sp. JES 115]
MDYTHLGGFKLGSLKITNGMASPAPSMTNSKNVSRRQSTPDLQHREDDYFTASEGCASPERITPDNTWQTELASQTSMLPRAPMSRKVRTRQDALKSKASGSPLRIERRRHNSDNIRSNDRSPISDSVVGHTGHCSALDLAETYMAELPASPYGNRSPPKDDLAREDASDIDSATAALRTDALCKLNGTSGEEDTAPLWQDSDFKLPPLTDFTHNNKLKTERPAHVKADSGYSSGNSLITLQTKWNAEDDASIYSKRASQYDILQITGSDDARSTHASQQAPSSSASSKRSVEASRSTTEESADTLDQEKARPSKTRRKSIIRSISLGRAKHRSLPTTSTSSDLPPVPSSQSSEKSPRKGKKLQKQRPSGQVSPVVQGQRPIRAGSIPHVPDDVVAKFCKRIKSSPDMEHLKRTYASVKAGSNESFEEPIPLSVPIIFPGDSVRNSLAFDAEDEKLPPPPPPPHRQAPSTSSRRRSDSRSRSNYSGHKSEDYEFLGVSDFGTVAESLGGSPYDIAMGTLKAPSSAAPTQPHHLSTNVTAQSSSRTAMDSETAAAYARARSHDRAAPPERNAWSTSRPRSFHERDLKDGERYVKNFSRPHSMYDDAPPVPALPASRGSSNSASSTQNVAELPASPVKSRAELPAENTSPASAPAAETNPPFQRLSTGIDWESHRNLWRQRRKSIGEGLLRRSTEPTTDSDGALVAPKAAAPAIVVSRYITPIQHPSASTAPTTTAFPPKRPASPSIAALAARFEKQQQQEQRQQDPEPPATRPTKSSTDLPIPPGRHSADSVRSARSSIKSTKSAEDVRDSMTDRYSGGLGYGYEAGFGLGGSAGTRHLRSAASRKSLEFAHQFGVDLSDVPVFVTKAGW